MLVIMIRVVSSSTIIPGIVPTGTYLVLTTTYWYRGYSLVEVRQQCTGRRSCTGSMVTVVELRCSTLALRLNVLSPYKPILKSQTVENILLPPGCCFADNATAAKRNCILGFNR